MLRFTSKKKRMMIIVLGILLIVAAIVCWVEYVSVGYGSFTKEKKEIIRRANYLTSKVVTSPQELFDEMPSGIGSSLKGNGHYILVR